MVKASILNEIRNNSPLVHNITNYVVMNNTANALLSVGASPVMAHSLDEVEDIISISSSLVINMGTLSELWVDSMIKAGKKANELKKPIVFDPVGIGASSYRTEIAKEIIEKTSPCVIRGNASEIMVLAQLSSVTKGVDSTAKTVEALDGAIQLSKELNNTVVVSGETDYIVTRNKVSSVNNGREIMSKVTGMGCTATSVIGASIAVEDDVHEAAVFSMALMGVAGEIAESKSNGPGSFQISFLDTLSSVSSKIISDNARIND
tara:strand:- start:1465 stop:2253 length:789 start_codon:yes stop_codon:yes gene_type:complete